jgi:hypothetical protein
VEKTLYAYLRENLVKSDFSILLARFSDLRHSGFYHGYGGKSEKQLQKNKILIN